MQNNYFLCRLVILPRLITASRCMSQHINIEKLEEADSSELEVDEETKIKEELIEKQRNKSRLQPAHRNIMLGKVPHDEPQLWTHGTLKYQRKMFGRYGSDSHVNSSLCWPTSEELSLKKEYEQVAHPYSITEMMVMAKTKRDEKTERIRKRQEEIEYKMTKLDMWKRELFDKINKKESDAVAAKNRKERLIEEVRRHFGYTVDPRDDKFKEMLEKKEKEQKKAMKEARKKAKEDKMITKLIAKSDSAEVKEK